MQQQQHAVIIMPQQQQQQQQQQQHHRPSNSSRSHSDRTVASSSSSLMAPKGRRAPESATTAAFVTTIHLLCFGCIIAVAYWCVSFRGGLAWSSSNKDLIFNVHPVLMIAGFIVICSEGNLAYRMVEGNKRYKKLVHLVLQGAALLLGSIGVFAAFKFHNEKGIDNLYSLHSWLGMLTLVAFAVQWLIGFTVFWYPGGLSHTRAGVLPWHVFLGLFIYGLALTCAETGLLEKLTFLQGGKKIGRFSPEAMFVNGLGVALVVLGALVVWTTFVHGQKAPQLHDK